MDSKYNDEYLKRAKDTEDLAKRTNALKDTYISKYNDDEFKGYKRVIVPIDSLVEHNDLNNSVALNNHYENWDKEAKNEDEINLNRFNFNKDLDNGYIYGDFKDGKYILGDGRHRVRALKNLNVKNIELYIRDDED